jgi:hypothetical protein
LPRSSCSWGLVVARAAAPPPIAEDICWVASRRLQRQECFCQEHVGCWKLPRRQTLVCKRDNNKLPGGWNAHIIYPRGYVYIHIYIYIHVYMYTCMHIYKDAHRSRRRRLRLRACDSV